MFSIYTSSTCTCTFVYVVYTCVHVYVQYTNITLIHTSKKMCINLNTTYS